MDIRIVIPGLPIANPDPFAVGASAAPRPPGCSSAGPLPARGTRSPCSAVSSATAIWTAGGATWLLMQMTAGQRERQMGG